MISLTITAGLLVAVISCWLLTERSRYPRLIWCAVPVLLAWPVCIFWYGGTLLGYATYDHLPDDFQLVSSYADESRKAIFATVRLKGETEPRLYAVTGDFEANRKSFAKAQGDVGKGLPIAGKSRPGVSEGGEFQFYVLPPAGIPDKG